MSINASTYQIPSSIPTVSGQKTDYSKIQNEEMGEKEFLMLFTAQLQNQNPLDPMENEAFVAQLAQFSQLEATTTMSDKMTGLVDALRGQRLMDGSSLIGKQVAVPNGPAILRDGAAISGVITVPDGASSVSYTVYNRNGTVVKSEELGRKPPGDVLVRWDGTNQAGQKMQDGAYQIVVNVRSPDGSNTTIPIATPDTVKSVTYSSEADDLILETVNGGTVNFSQVKQING
ncbi:MAG: Basal-body rod modification protein FlgD [Pseudomonadota bacterium]|jgi:flagellar basal-body rod modification protein FlgD